MEENKGTDAAGSEDSLEGSKASVQSGATTTTTTGTASEQKQASTLPGDKSNPVKRILSRVNIYLVIFIFLLVLAGAGMGIGYLNSKKTPDAPDIDSQTLSQDALNQLSNTDAKVGDAKSVLTVQSNAVFQGQIVAGGDVSIAGTLKVGKPLTLNSLSVTGTSTLNDIQAQVLSLASNAAIQGKLAVQGDASFGGATNFSGSVTANEFIVNKLILAGNGSLQLNNHVTAGGPAPRLAFGNALGGGGTASISGSDTAGSVSVNTGGGTAAGCFANITFAQAYGSTPSIIATPVGAAAGGIDFYVTRTNTGFSICTSSPAPAGQSFGFDYIVIE